MADSRLKKKLKKDDPRRKAPGWMRKMFTVKGYAEREADTHRQGAEKPKDRPDSYVLDKKKKKR